MRIAFLGSGSFGLPTLRALCAEHEVVVVVSQPDRPAGRGRRPAATPVAAYAEAHGMPLVRTENANDAAVVERIASTRPDALVVIAFGQKLRPALLDGRFAINLHASLLPRHRGAAPINWAILAGDERTGVSVITLAQRMDAGRVLAEAETEIHPRETAGELHDRLAELGPAVVLETLRRFERGELEGREQDEASATRAPKLSRDDATIDFADSAQHVRQRVHGLSPWPGIAVDLGGTRLRLLRVADETCDVAADPGTLLEDGRVRCGTGAVRLLEVQPDGGRPMSMADFLRGRRVAAGARLDTATRQGTAP